MGLTGAGRLGLQSGAYNHHAWVTLESGEILDMTIASSLALETKHLSPETKRQAAGGVVGGYSDEILKNNGLEYFPILLGEHFYQEYDVDYEIIKSKLITILNSKPKDSHTRFEKPNFDS